MERSLQESYAYQPVSTLQLLPPSKSFVSFLFNRAYSIITNKDYLDKESARIKQVLQENEYQESIISKIFKRITNNHSLSNSQQQTQSTDMQEEEIIMLKLKVLVKNYNVYSSLKKQDPLSLLKALCENCFVKLNIKQPQKIKTISFMNWLQLLRSSLLR